LDVGQLLEELDEKERHVHTFSTPKPITTHTPTPVTEKHTGTGIMYGGGGKPMDLGEMREENHCFRCGEQGHFGRDCPHKKKFNICALLTKLDDDKVSELKEELNQKELDFADGR
jgi:Zinc knuckle